MINDILKKKFEKIIEFENIQWNIIDYIVQRDANILRPIKGVAFEEYFKKILRIKCPNVKINDGKGDSDIDLYVNKFSLQLKTPTQGPTIKEKTVGVALHKTHGLEKRPFNLYKISNRVFDFLVLFHPVSGIYIIPYNRIPQHQSWPGYLDDPAKIPWVSEYLNNWKLLGLNEIDGMTIDTRDVPRRSVLPFLSRETYLEDFEIIETLCKPEYFRAAVMGLKGNIKEYWLEERLKELGYDIAPPEGSYPKYDLSIVNTSGKKVRIQIKGTSKNMCNKKNCTIGVEVMGTHGRFPSRGYNKNMIDFVAVVISSNQLEEAGISSGLHFIMIPVDDLPLHYKIGKGKEFKEPLWDKKEYSEIVYPIIKLKINKKKSDFIEFVPNIESYGKYKGNQIIAEDSLFRFAGPFRLDFIPDQFHN